MVAKFIKLGEPAHDCERNAIQYLVEGLPSTYTVYGNAWIVERSGAIYELDAVVAAPHAVYVVEIKCHRGDIVGNDYDWFAPDPMRSPIALNRKTAQTLLDGMKRASATAGNAYVEGLVFLNQARSVKLTGPASEGRVHLRASILQDLQSPEALFKRSNRGRTPPVDAHTAKVLDALLRQADAKKPPTRRVRDYEIEATLEQNDRYTEWLGKHALTGDRRVLRVYHASPLAAADEQKKLEDRVRWEAQVLGRVALHPHILHADPLFLDESGICLPLEYFHGATLPSWIQKFHGKLSGKDGLSALVGVWRKVAGAISYAHQQGIVHRLLRPEVILLRDEKDDPDVRVTGFDLAKQMHAKGTILVSTLNDDRLRWAAPEVLQAFSTAEPRSDQFALGALLGLLVAGKPLFSTTADILRRKGLITRLRDARSFVPQALDEAVERMLSIRLVDRFASVDEAIVAVMRAVEGKPAMGTAPLAAPFNPEAIEEGTRIGPDYEISGLLGKGGLATVYAARHLVSGAHRALKVARPEPPAEEALSQEYKALLALDHPAIVRVIDISNIIPARRTLVMERVSGMPLSRYLLETPSPSPRLLRRFAEDLLSALLYLEQKGVTHKDLKPENLVVSDGGLTVIDFSLAGEPPDALLIGTPLYRDPALGRWSHEADRYAAALCMFELFSGRHAFGGLAPGPGDAPDIDDDELEPPSLGPFFQKALDPQPSLRFPSAVALQAAFLRALGERTGASEPPPAPGPAGEADAALPLGLTGLGEGTLHILRRAGVRTQGELVATGEASLGRLPGLGNKKRGAVIRLRRELMDQGVEAASRPGAERRCLWTTLVGDPSDVQRLELPAALTSTLVKAGYSTVGKLAEATREELTALGGVGEGRVAQAVGALQTFAEQGAGQPSVTSTERLWEKATTGLDEVSRKVLDLTCGMRGRALDQTETAKTLSLTQPAVSHLRQRALDKLDPRALEPVRELLQQHLEVSGGILTRAEAGQQIEASFPTGGDIQGAALASLLAELSPADVSEIRFDDDGHPVEVLARPFIQLSALRAFLRAAREIAGQWPLARAEGARRDLRPHLPEYDLDLLLLATRLLPDLGLTEAGELFETPVDPKHAVQYVLDRERPPLALAELHKAIHHAFGQAAPLLEGEALRGVLGGFSDYRIEGETIEPVTRGGPRPARGERDPLPPELLAPHKSPEQVVGELLRAASRTARYRLLVTPPEHHLAIGRSVALALGEGATFLSFESELLQRMEAGDFASFVRAERFLAQRSKLRKEADNALEDLFEKHGKPGAVVVLGDTGILGVCDAHHLVRRIYDETVAGNQGFWAVVVPGLLRKNQALFNESDQAPLFSLPGATLPLMGPIPS